MNIQNKANPLTERAVRIRAKQLGFTIQRKSKDSICIYNHGGYKILHTDSGRLISGSQYQLTLEMVTEILDIYEANPNLFVLYVTVRSMKNNGKLGVQVNVPVCKAAIDDWCALDSIYSIDKYIDDDEQMCSLFARFDAAVQKIAALTKGEFTHVYNTKEKSMSNELLGDNVLEELYKLYLERDRKDGFVSNLFNVSARIMAISNKYNDFWLMKNEYGHLDTKPI